MATRGSKRYNIRQAKLDDYEAVMAIDTHIYDGIDYLPDMYKYYLQDPRRISFLLEEDGRIIAFLMNYVVDDEQTMVTQAARISPDHRSLGFLKGFGSEVFLRSHQIFPTVTRFASVSFERELVLSKIRTRAWPHHLILNRMGFVVHYIMDDITACLARAARISKDQRLGGMWSFLKSESMRKCKEKYPMLKKCKATTSEKSAMLDLMRREKFTYNFMLTRTHITMTLQPGSQADMLAKKLTSLVKEVDAGEFRSIMSRPDNCWKLFPHKTIVISWEPFAMLPSNFDIISKKCNAILCTFETKDPDLCSTMSFGQYFQTKMGLRYDVEIYSNDIQESLDHITSHIQQSYKHYKRGLHSMWVYLCMHLPEDLFVQRIQENFPIQGTPGKSSMTFFEADLSINAKI